MSHLHVFDAALSERLVTTLFHVLWQGMAIAGALLAATPLLHRVTAATRYAVLVGALGITALCPVVTFVAVGRPGVEQAAASSTGRDSGGTTAAGAEGPAVTPDRAVERAGDVQAEEGGDGSGSPAAAAGAWWRPYSHAIALSYIAGVLFMLARVLATLDAGRRLLRRVDPAVDPWISETLRRLAAGMGMRFSPRLAACRDIVAPAVIGVLRPTILLPAMAATGLARDQIEMLLIHELAHLRRYDHLVNVAQRLIEAVLFFHPVVWFLSQRIRLEREQACDDEVLATGAAPAAYAMTLVDVAAEGRRLAAAAGPAVASIGSAGRPSQLRVRIVRLLGGAERDRFFVRARTRWGATLVAAIAALALLWPAACGEPAVRPEPQPGAPPSPGLEFVRDVIRSMDRDFVELSPNEITELKEKISAAVKKAERFIEANPGAPEGTEVRFHLARLLFVNMNVSLEESSGSASAEQRKLRRQEYLARIFQLIEQVEKAGDLPAAFVPQLLQFKGCVSRTADKQEDAARYFTEYLRSYPEAADVASGAAYYWAGRSYLYAEKFQEAEALLREGVEKCQEGRYFSHLVDTFFKSLTGTGKLEEAEALWLKWGPIFGDRAEDSGRRSDERRDYAAYHEWHLFYLGYIQFAQGRYKDAVESFDRQQKLAAALKETSPRTGVYLNRAKDLASYIREHVMTPAPEFAVGMGDRTFSVEEARGKVVAIVFRASAAERAHPTLKYLQKLYEERGGAAGPLAVASVSYLKKDEAEPEQREAILKEAQALGLTYPVGLDPTSTWELFRAYGVNVGSASLVIVDREGRIAYMEQDPRPNAHGLFRRVIERLTVR